jgi:hypothetical protein
VQDGLGGVPADSEALRRELDGARAAGREAAAAGAAVLRELVRRR